MAGLHSIQSNIWSFSIHQMYSQTSNIRFLTLISLQDFTRAATKPTSDSLDSGLNNNKSSVKTNHLVW